MRRRVSFLTAAAVCVLLTALVPARASAQSEVVEYYALDAIGSVRVVFDANGAIKSRRDYAPFGEEVTSIAMDPKIYAGLFRDEESTLDYAQARMHQSRTGRFTAVDPVYAGLFNPQGWNRYVYAANSPLVFVDPEGLNPDWCTTTYCELVTAPSNPLGFFYQPPIYGELPFTFFPRPRGGPVRQNPPSVPPTTPATPSGPSSPAPSPNPSPSDSNDQDKPGCSVVPVAPTGANLQRNMQEARMMRSVLPEHTPTWFYNRVKPGTAAEVRAGQSWDYKR